MNPQVTSNPNKVTIKCYEGERNSKKRSDVWRFFGELYKGNKQLDDKMHCKLCFGNKRGLGK